MNILIVGGGAREHALAWKAAQSDQVEQVWVAPGNAGTDSEPKVSNVDIAVTDIDELLIFAEREQVDLTIVGPEVPLSLGIVDRFHTEGLKCFGPTQQAAQLESSKRFCKDFLEQTNIPTAAYQCFTEVEPAITYLQQQTFPIVIKADGLAAGKGVVIACSLEEAEAAVRTMLEESQFGEAGHCIVIEEFLVGRELSYIVMVDGEHILPLASSQDHKRRNDGDTGPNTGGMGAYSPATGLSQELEQKILATIIEPTVQALAKNGTPYTGFLYAGLMITPEGEPKVLEFNCRCGDPETQPIMMRLQSDLVTLCHAAVEGQLDQHTAQWDSRVALGVVLASADYPLQYPTGMPILGLDTINDNDCKVFHAGTEQQGGQVVTAGGRVLTVVALADDYQSAQTKAYAAAEKITWDGIFYRHDIGYQAIESDKFSQNLP